MERSRFAGHRRIAARGRHITLTSVPTEASLLFAMYAAARTIPLALFALAAIYKRATTALLILGALAGAMQLLDAGIGLFEHDLGKCAGPLLIAVLQFLVVSRAVLMAGSINVASSRCWPTTGTACTTQAMAIRICLSRGGGNSLEPITGWAIREDVDWDSRRISGPAGLPTCHIIGDVQPTSFPGVLNV
jgi:hypothetical protein